VSKNIVTPRSSCRKHTRVDDLRPRRA
jgi:hypothetical protein